MRIGKSIFLERCIALFIAGACFGFQSPQGQASIASIKSLIRSRQYDQALEITRSALEKTPKHVRLLTLEGIILSMKGSNRDALNAFESALSLSPNYTPALRGEVQLLYESHDERAIPPLEKILKTDPQDETAQEMLATLEARRGDCQAATGHFLLCASEIQDHPESLEAYGYCLVQARRPEAAIPVFRQLVRLLPQPAYPKYDLAVVLVEAKQDEAALKVLDPLLRTDQRDPDVLSLASEAYEAAHNTPKAVSLLRQAIVLRPAEKSYYIAFAALCLNHDSFRAGIDMLNAGLERISGDPSLYIARGLLRAKLAQYDEAESDFNTAERLDSAQSLSSYALDLAELEKNHPGAALSHIRAQLKAHPDSAMLDYLLAKLLFNQGLSTQSEAFGEAMSAALQAVKLNPNYTKARDLAADLYMRSGRYGAAIEQSRLALRADPSDRTAIYHLIIALRHSGQKGQSGEIQALVKRLADLQQASLRQEIERKRFRLVEGARPVKTSAGN